MYSQGGRFAVAQRQTKLEHIRWQLVQTRDSTYDGLFYYGVSSTGVFCKPSCPSRRPRREAVVFFESCEDAEAAGYRACLRCDPRNTEALRPEAHMVEKACRAIEASNGSAPTLSQLSESLGVSRFHLHRAFKQHTGVTPRRYAEANRMKQFKKQIKEGQDVTAAIYEAGYGSSSRLYEKAPELLGMTPASYARGGEGMQIKYAIAESPLGRLLVAATERGISAVSLGDSDSILEEALALEYPKAELQRDDQELRSRVNLILAYLSGDRKHLVLPLDLQATTFQLRVWEELRRIPYGATRSYSEIAVAIGRPTATRAVARACAANPVALVTPCHRVVREDGNPGGYRWGLGRKQKLLAKEQGRQLARKLIEDV
jgi:AraC family transcriptional regulator, regulatory protein of adaptative response / methylated-DNA-[protein]-cysteine methyltransferase